MKQESPFTIFDLMGECQYDALELIKSQVEAFGYNTKEIAVAVPEFGKPATLDAIADLSLSEIA